MSIFRRQQLTSILIIFLMSLHMSACTSSEDSNAVTENIGSGVTTNTDANHAAIITDTNSGNVTVGVDANGDKLLEISGKLTITDSDAGEAAFIAETVTGTYGSLTIDADGNWNYAATNSQGAIQDLATTDTLTDSLVVSSVDGTTHTVSMTITGVDDIPVFSGDSSGSITEDLNPDSTNRLTTSGKLTVTGGDAGEAVFIASTIPGTFGSLTIDADGNWGYAAANSQGPIQGLVATATLTDSLVVSSVDGTQHTVVVTITGVDDIPVFSGDSSGSISEDINPDSTNNLTTSGKLAVTGGDAGEAVFTAKTVTSTYGSLTIDAAGNWSYAAGNSQSAIQGLAGGATLTDNLSVSSIDGTEHTVVMTITGMDDIPVIAGVDSGSVTEDVDPDGDNLLETSGKLTITDSDAGEAAFIAGSITGTFGSLTISADGNWDYAADNNQIAIQGLATADTLTDDLVVSSVDGTQHTVKMTITGVDYAPVFSGNSSGSITEDVDPDGDNLLETSGKLTITDGDAGEATFIAETVTGTFGSLTIATDGNWNYAANNNQSAIQGLATAATLTDNLVVSSIDGTQHSVVMTITGVDYAPVFSGDSSGSVTEDMDPDGDTLLETNGKLTITDDDAGEAAFTAGTIPGTFGSLTIDTAGNWDYAAGNSQAAIQELDKGATLTDNLVVSSVDGSTHNVVITINGVYEPNTIIISWAAPAEREDNSSFSLSAIAGYQIYYGTVQSQYKVNTAINDGTATHYAFSGLPAGTYYFVVTTIDTKGRESENSSEVTVTIQDIP